MGVYDKMNRSPHNKVAMLMSSNLECSVEEKSANVNEIFVFKNYFLKNKMFQIQFHKRQFYCEKKLF